MAMNRSLPRQRSHKRTQQMYDMIASIIIIAAVVFAIFPIIWTGLTSLKSEQDVVTNDLQYIPQNPTLETTTRCSIAPAMPTCFATAPS